MTLARFWTAKGPEIRSQATKPPPGKGKGRGKGGGGGWSGRGGGGGWGKGGGETTFPVSAAELAVFTILGAPQEVASARSFEMYTIVEV